MPEYTKNLKLIKNTEDEFYNVAVQNANMDSLDTYVTMLEEENKILREELSNKANVGTPVEYAIEFVDGYATRTDRDAKSIYIKTQEDIVHVIVACEKTDGTPIVDIPIFAALPVGFRPPSNLYVSAVYHDVTGNSYENGYVGIGTDGAMRAVVYSTTANKIGVAFSFPAAQ